MGCDEVLSTVVESYWAPAGEDGPTAAQKQCLRQNAKAALMPVVQNHECSIAELKAMQQHEAPSCTCGSALFRAMGHLVRECDVQVPEPIVEKVRAFLLAKCDEVLSKVVESYWTPAGDAGSIAEKRQCLMTNFWPGLKSILQNHICSQADVNDMRTVVPPCGCGKALVTLFHQMAKVCDLPGWPGIPEQQLLNNCDNALSTWASARSYDATHIVLSALIGGLFGLAVTAAMVKLFAN